MKEEFEAGLYISEAEDIVKCPYCNGYAEYHLRTGGSHSRQKKKRITGR